MIQQVITNTCLWHTESYPEGTLVTVTYSIDWDEDYVVTVEGNGIQETHHFNTLAEALIFVTRRLSDQEGDCSV